MWRRTIVLAMLTLAAVPMPATPAPATAPAQPKKATPAPPELVAELRPVVESARLRFEARDARGVLANVSDQYRSAGMTKAALREQLLSMFALYDAMRVRLTIDRVQLVEGAVWVYTSGEVNGRLPFIGWMRVLAWQNERRSRGARAPDGGCSGSRTSARVRPGPALAGPGHKPHDQEKSHDCLEDAAETAGGFRLHRSRVDHATGHRPAARSGAGSQRRRGSFLGYRQAQERAGRRAGAGAGLPDRHAGRQAADCQDEAAAGVQGRGLRGQRPGRPRPAAGRQGHRLRQLAVRGRQGLRDRRQGRHARGEDDPREDRAAERDRVPQGLALRGHAQGHHALRRHRGLFG